MARILWRGPRGRSVAGRWARLAVCWLFVALVIFQGNVIVAEAQPAAAASPVSVSPAVLDFGSASEYSVGSVKQFTVSTTRAAVLTLPGVLPFTPVGGTCPLTATSYGPTQLTLAAGASCTVAMQFFPMQAMHYAIHLSIFWAIIPFGNSISQGYSGPINFTATSTPVPPPWTWSPDPLDFGGQAPYTTSNPRTLTLTTALPAELLYISPVSGSFEQTQSTCHLYQHLAAGDSCTLTIAFAPNSLGVNTIPVSVQLRPQNFPAPAGFATFTTALMGTGIPAGNEAAMANLTYYTTTSDVEAPHIHAGEQVAFVATVKPADGTVSVTGAVVFYDVVYNQITAIGTVSLYSYNANSYATLFSTMTKGTHLITAVYSGDRTFGVAFSEPLTIVVT